ncbi:MAG: chromosome segregation protein SMC [Bifidobacteriaceae bacterium]|jgi:chromosome segregation protein|nr:chromosome segregation protein SMC [Bifidobacteriaceae bacterium]
MYLKELTLRGFKSFASATTLRFEPGITAVVGPNGSGKSNIVDALAWVMGEQGAKTLRGSSMEDVIFAGTSSRPPLGRAQVSLTIDNTDHTLDIEYSEVTISRTIFRSGGSEYAINGTPVRLLDVQELLSDTGLGSQMHVIVGQGRLSTILHADPAGHRAIIEEAAGILKHRRRKERSLRKLKSTQDNLARIDDLLTEINRQLGPLRRQARISRRADGIQVSLRDAKARLLADDVAQLNEQRASNRRRLGEVRTQLSTQQKNLARAKLHIEHLEQETSATSPAITALTNSAHRFAQIDERYASLGQLAEERMRALDATNDTRPTADPEILEKRAAELDAQVSTQQESAQKLSVTQEKTTEERAGKEAQLAAVRQTIGELRRTTKEREGNVARLQQLIARQENLLESSVTRVADYEEQRGSVAEQLRTAETEIEGLRKDSDSADTNDLEQSIDTAKSALDSAKDTLHGIVDARSDVQNQKIRLDARADALKDTVEQRQSRTSLASNAALKTLGGLASFIEVSEGWEEAIATALRQFSSALVVGDEESLATALSIAAQEKTERTALIAPATHSEASNKADEKSVPDEHGIYSAGSLISVPADTRDSSVRSSAAAGILSAVRTLLDGVGVCDTWEHGTAALANGEAARSAEGRWRSIVTRDGEILTPVGVVTAASSAPSDLSLLARRQKALKESSALAEKLAALEAQVSQGQEQVEKLTEKLTQLTAARAERRIAAKQAATAIDLKTKQLEDYRRRLKTIDDSVAAIRKESQEAGAKKRELAAALEQAQTKGEDSFSLEDFEKREEGLEKDLTSAREAELTAKLAATDAARKAESLGRQAQMLHDDARHATAQRAAAQERARKRAQQRTQAAAIAEQITKVRAMVAACLKQVNARRDEAQKQASVHDEELTRLRGVRNELEPVVGKLSAEEHELDVARERYATQFGQVSQKVTDELGMQTDVLVQEYGPDQPVPELTEQGEPIPVTEEDAAGAVAYRTVPYVRAEQEKRLKKAEADLAKLGKVNPLATEEFDALQERHTYLNDQRNDVATSRDDLLGIVKDLDATMQRVFKEAFDDVAEAFEKIFAVLFPGGHGRLRLENENDLLNTGVLVEASPAGKRVKQLTLLSGGEKSLTALALLLAIFTARPSPFYVMDEVEAALDDLNLTRLLEALKQLREHAQLIIITHQQRTMAIADALYGITMRSDGVTAVISQKVER